MDAPELHAAHGAGHGLRDALTHKYGPLPGWAWGLGAGVVLALYLHHKGGGGGSGSGSSLVPASSGDPLALNPLDGGGAGAGDFGTIPAQPPGIFDPFPGPDTPFAPLAPAAQPTPMFLYFTQQPQSGGVQPRSIAPLETPTPAPAGAIVYPGSGGQSPRTIEAVIASGSAPPSEAASYLAYYDGNPPPVPQVVIPDYGPDLSDPSAYVAPAGRIEQAAGGGYAINTPPKGVVTSAGVTNANVEQHRSTIKGATPR